MKDNYFNSGVVSIGGKPLAFVKKTIQGGYSMYVPECFFEDKNLVSQYTYLFSKDKSPLSIAVKYSDLSSSDDRNKIISHYFSNAKESQAEPMQKLESGIFFRETVTGGKYLSIYSLRFAVDTGSGILFGCFNCSAAYKDDWREAVLEIIKNIEPGD